MPNLFEVIRTTGIKVFEFSSVGLLAYPIKHANKHFIPTQGTISLHKLSLVNGIVPEMLLKTADPASEIHPFGLRNRTMVDRMAGLSTVQEV